MRLARSVLFVPANRLKLMQKAVGLRADVIIFDLEDAVSVDDKLTARENLIKFLGSRNLNIPSPRIAARINCPLTSEWGQKDLDALLNRGKEEQVALVIPKVGNVDSLDFVERFMVRSRPFPLWPMIETAQAVLNASTIAAHKTVECLVFGCNDLTVDIKAKFKENRQPLWFSMSQCVVAARAYNKMAIDGVYMDIKNNTGLAEDCTLGKDFGFNGKSLIHPDQIDVCNKVYSPSESDIHHAKRVVSAFELSRAEGKSLAVLDGKLIEALHVDAARDVIKISEHIQKVV